MAANAWALYIFEGKYLRRFFEWIKTRHVSKQAEQSDLLDLETCKKLSMAATLVFMAPLCIQMVRRMTKDNFCQYMALCNFIAFNFGFHVHEKAMLLVTIPLGIDLVIKTKNTTAILRFKILKLVLMWTLLPLIFTPRETFLKHSLLVLDVLITDALLPTK